MQAISFRRFYPLAVVVTVLLTICLCGCARGSPNGASTNFVTSGSVSDGDANTTPAPAANYVNPQRRADDGPTFAFSAPFEFNELSGEAAAITGPRATSQISALSTTKSESEFAITGFFGTKEITYRLRTPIVAYSTGGTGEVLVAATINDASGTNISSAQYKYVFRPNPANPGILLVTRTGPGAATNLPSSIPNGGTAAPVETGQSPGLSPGRYKFIFELNITSLADGKTTVSATTKIDAN